MPLLAGASLTAGCGASSAEPDPSRQARIVAEANAFCERISPSPSAPARYREGSRAVDKRIETLARELRSASAYLPAGRDLNDALLARHTLETAHTRHEDKHDFDIRFDRLQLRIYRDEYVLGLRCAGGVAREAHGIERMLASESR